MDQAFGMNRRLTLVFVFLFSLACHGAGWTEEEYQALKKAAYLVAPGENAVVIGIGRSPAPVIAFLRKLKPGTVFSFPLSKFRHLPQGPHYGVDEEWEELYDFLSGKEQERLFQHFDQFVPSEALIGKRKVELLDYSRRGDHLFSAKAYLEKYFSARSRTHEISLVALTQPQFEAEIKKRAAITGNEIKTILLEDSIFRYKLDRSQYDDIAEYGKYEIRKTPSLDPKPGAEYEAFNQWLQARMQKDSLIPKKCRLMELLLY